MLNFIIFLPLLAGTIILMIPKEKSSLIRKAAFAGAGLNFILSLFLLAGFNKGESSLQFEFYSEWIPSIGASYHLGLDGISLPLILLTNLLMLSVSYYVINKYDRAKEHSFLFLLMQTGLLGVFSAQDLLLFYLFFEVGLVPMYFIIGIWGSGNRKYAAMKFFIYTRAGSLAMLLSFLALYLAVEPNTFSLAVISEENPFAGNLQAGCFVLLGLLIGFGVKLPSFPLHNWLPDAHVEAPTEGSVILAGIQLKMGAYGIIKIALNVVPDAIKEYAWWIIFFALISMIYSALAALAQKDLKRLIAYTSINHMAYVMLAAGVFGILTQTSVRQLAVNGAVYQIVSHGILTGGMFFIVGALQHQAGTRNIDRFGGLIGVVPLFAVLLGALSFASFGLPGFSGFIAEFQVIGAAVNASITAAVFTVIGLIIMTALYLKIVVNVLMGEPPEDMPRLEKLNLNNKIILITLTGLSLLLGILPGLLISIINASSAAMAAL